MLRPLVRPPHKRSLRCPLQCVVALLWARQRNDAVPLHVRQSVLELAADGKSLYCAKLDARYAIVDGVPLLKLDQGSGEGSNYGENNANGSSTRQ
jgi:hypothetical protein